VICIEISVSLFKASCVLHVTAVAVRYTVILVKNGNCVLFDILGAITLLLFELFCSRL